MANSSALYSSRMRKAVRFSFSVTQLDLKLIGPLQNAILVERLRCLNFMITALHPVPPPPEQSSRLLPLGGGIAPLRAASPASPTPVGTFFASSASDAIPRGILLAHLPRLSLPFSLLCICKERQALPSNERGP